MGHYDRVKGIRYKQVYILIIGLIHIYCLMYFYYLPLFVIYVLLLDKLRDLLLYLSPSMMRCASTELLNISQTVGVSIGKRISD